MRTKKVPNLSIISLRCVRKKANEALLKWYFYLAKRYPCTNVASVYFLFLWMQTACIDSKPRLWFQVPHGERNLQVYEQASWAYGPHQIRVYYREKEKNSQPFLVTSLYNDGANLGKHNYTLSWESNQCIRLVLRGDEQADSCYLLYLEASPWSETCEEGAKP